MNLLLVYLFYVRSICTTAAYMAFSGSMQKARNLIVCIFLAASLCDSYTLLTGMECETLPFCVAAICVHYSLWVLVHMSNLQIAPWVLYLNRAKIPKQSSITPSWFQWESFDKAQIAHDFDTNCNLAHVGSQLVLDGLRWFLASLVPVSSFLFRQYTNPVG